MKYSYAILTLLLLMLSGCNTETVSTAEEEPIELNLALGNSENTNYYKGASKIAEEVALATDDRIQINIIAGGSLGGELDTVEQTIMGDLDMTVASNSVLSNFIPEMSILDRAFLFENAEQAHATVDGPVGDLIEEEARELNLHVVGYMESGFRNLFSTRAVDSIEDLRGLKVRTMENKYHMAAFESFGAIPLALPANEQFTALQQGTVDALENAVANAWTAGYYEVAQDITTIDYAYVYMLVMMSDESWEKIPEDLQEPFMKAVEKGYQAQRDYLLEANIEAQEELEKVGVTFHTIDQSELRDSYFEMEKEKGFQFDPAWEEAVEAAIKSQQ